MIMDTITLCRMACNDIVMKSKFGGVFALDELPASKGRYNAFIVNTEGKNLPGSHWLAMFFDEKQNKCYYFDSYGFPPLHREIMQFLKKNAGEIYYNQTRYQQTGASTCGLYCLYFLYRYSRHLYNLQPLSGNNRKQNEIFIKHFIFSQMNLADCCRHSHQRAQSCKVLKTA